MKAKKSLVILIALLLLMFIPASYILAEESGGKDQSHQIIKTSTVTPSTNQAAVSSIEIQNNSEEDMSYYIFWIDVKRLKIFEKSSRVDLVGGELKAGCKEIYNSKFNLGQCRIQWGPSRMWEKIERFEKNFTVNSGQKVIITSNPKDEPIIMSNI